MFTISTCTFTVRQLVHIIQFTKSTNIINNALIGFIYHEYLVLATEIKCLGRREAEML
jgi:hypothetical protein